MKKSILIFAAVAAVGLNAKSETVDWNDGWEFSRDKQEWRPVEVPHDWAVESNFDVVKYPAWTGGLPWAGVGYYRKRLVVDKVDPAKRYFLEFGGVQGTATVKVNGESVAKWPYGYLGFEADLNPYLLDGTNTVVVTADTTKLFSRWYPGAGMCRGVKLKINDDVRLLKKEFYVRSELKLKRDRMGVITNSSAKVKIDAAVFNDRMKEAEVGVAAELYAPDGKLLASKSGMKKIDSCREKEIEFKFDIFEPELWTMNDPAPLYKVRLLLTGEGISDTLETRIGIRDFKFDAKKGFYLNGERVQLKGVDLHADLGILGMAFNKSAMKRQLKKMRDMGANALRTSHNPPAEEVLDLCDEMGIFVWDEAFDKWNATTGRGDEPLDEFVPRVLREFVKRDRNHPCVFVWSIGNEIPSGGGSAPGQEMWGIPQSVCTTPQRCARFRAVIRELDKTRPVGIGSCFPQAIPKGDYAPLDITGWNYRELYNRMLKAYPKKPVLYTESASAFSDFGFYAETLPTNKTDYAWAEHKVDSYDRNAAAWSDIPDIEFERMERDRGCGGEFVWTGIDYLGEPSPMGFGEVPEPERARSSYFGIYDLLVFPKDRVYLYRSHWNPEAFTLHIVPDRWNFAEGRKLPVYVYSNAAKVELFVNGKSYGTRMKDPNAKGGRGDYMLNGPEDEAEEAEIVKRIGRDYYAILKRYRFIWDEVAFEQGEIKAVAYDKDGKVMGEKTLKTAGEAKTIKIEPEEKEIPADGETLVFVKLEVVDGEGVRCPDDMRHLSFKLEGPGKIVAVGNADPRGKESFKDVSGHSVYFGRAGLCLKRLKPGKITLEVSGEGLQTAAVEF